jgi:hypothetical protein
LTLATALRAPSVFWATPCALQAIDGKSEGTLGRLARLRAESWLYGRGTGGEPLFVGASRRGQVWNLSYVGFMTGFFAASSMLLGRVLLENRRRNLSRCTRARHPFSGRIAPALTPLRVFFEKSPPACADVMRRIPSVPSVLSSADLIESATHACVTSIDLRGRAL